MCVLIIYPLQSSQTNLVSFRLSNKIAKHSLLDIAASRTVTLTPEGEPYQPVYTRHYNSTTAWAPMGKNIEHCVCISTLLHTQQLPIYYHKQLLYDASNCTLFLHNSLVMKEQLNSLTGGCVPWTDSVFSLSYFIMCTANTQGSVVYSSVF